MRFASLLALMAAASAGAADPPADAVRSAFPAGDGLAVQVGAADGAFVGALTNGGRRLVHGLTADDATRDRVRAALHQQGVHPLATVATWHGGPALPYADRLVNLLIVDRDELGAKAPAEAECLRVVAPGGAILARSGGAWKATTAPAPAAFGNWTHFDGGADGNALSPDTAVDGMRSLQWIDNARPAHWMKTGPHGGDGGNQRVWGRYALIDVHVEKSRNPKEPQPQIERLVLECRDVSNGLLLWQKERDGDTADKRWALVVADGVAYTYLRTGEPISAIDLATGEVLRTFPGTEVAPWSPSGKTVASNRMWGDSYWIRVVGDQLVMNGGGALRAFGVRDAKPRWTLKRDGRRFDLPVVDAAKGRVYAALLEDVPIGGPNLSQGPVYWGRWPSSRHVAGIVAVDLGTGAVAWESAEIASIDLGMNEKTKQPERRAVGQLLPVGDHLVAFNSMAISGGTRSFIASLRADTGKLVHLDDAPFKTKDVNGMRPTGALYGILARDGIVYAYGSFKLFSYDPATGAQEQQFSASWNARCHRPVATASHFILGQTAFVRRDFTGEMSAIARSGCAKSPVVAGGLVLFGPHVCHCVTHFDGFLAISPRPAPEPLGDAQRLVACAPTAVAVPAASQPPAPERCAIATSWGWFTISEPVAPITVEAGGRTFAIDPLRHRVDVGGGGTPWSFVADARLGRSVVVHGGIAVIGSHDGWVHGLDLATGRPKWRHLVAPAQRLIVANGMLTSQWPVFGVADLGGGRVVASAGTHAELGGGIRVAALNAADGTVAWTKTLAKPPSQLVAGGRGSVIVDRSVMNAAPTVEAGKVVIRGGDDGGKHLGGVDFDPGEDAAAINARLAKPPAKGK